MRKRIEYDFAYGCFLLWGLTSVTLSVMRASYTDAEWAGGAGAILLLLLPLILVAFVAMLVAIVLSLRIWKHRPLVIITGTTVLLIAEYILGFGSGALQNAIVIIYGLSVATMSGMWFLVLRKEHLPPPLPGQQGNAG